MVNINIYKLIDL